jgi:hypothetical protein
MKPPPYIHAITGSLAFGEMPDGRNTLVDRQSSEIELVDTFYIARLALVDGIWHSACNIDSNRLQTSRSIVARVECGSI